MRIAYITNLSPKLLSGGFSGMNVAMLAALKQSCDVTQMIGPINPQPLWRERLRFKASRIAARRAQFFFFSERRLHQIAAAVSRDIQKGDSDIAFFHGFTPWVYVRSPLPYIAWSDCTFRDYVDIYHQRSDFNPADLKRIEEAEAQWLCSARAVLFTSEWAADRAAQHYSLDRSKLRSVGLCGALEPPQVDEYSGSSQFAFISTDFAAKGGSVVVEAFTRVRKKYPQASLVIVGDDPPKFVRAQPGISCAGFLRKEHPDERQKLRAVLARSRALVHPTKADIAPLLVVEAAYFGCPCVASRRYALPEIVADGDTGTLLSDPESVAEVASAMEALLARNAEYTSMRRATWSRSRAHFSEEKFQERVSAAVAFFGA